MAPVAVRQTQHNTLIPDSPTSSHEAPAALSGCGECGDDRNYRGKTGRFSLDRGDAQDSAERMEWRPIVDEQGWALIEPLPRDKFGWKPERGGHFHGGYVRFARKKTGETTGKGEQHSVQGAERIEWGWRRGDARSSTSAKRDVALRERTEAGALHIPPGDCL